MLWPRNINKHHLTTTRLPKSIKNHQKTSRNITKDHLVFFGHLVFGGLLWWWSSGLWWSFLLVFLDVCWCLLMFLDVLWCFLIHFGSILVVKWWSGETRKRSIGRSSMLSKPSKNIKNHQKPSKNMNKHQKTSTNIKKDHLVFSGHLVFRGLFW